jgi:hypothetical protein
MQILFSLDNDSGKLDGSSALCCAILQCGRLTFWCGIYFIGVYIALLLWKERELQIHQQLSAAANRPDITINQRHSI